MGILQSPGRVPRHRKYEQSSTGHGVWLCCRFCLRYRDVEALLFARGVSVTYEAIRKQRFTAIGGEAEILICWSQLYRAFPVLTALTPVPSAARMPPFSNILAAMAVVPPLGRSREMRVVWCVQSSVAAAMSLYPEGATPHPHVSLSLSQRNLSLPSRIALRRRRGRPVSPPHPADGRASCSQRFECLV
jgi:hypothetical protein